MENILIFPFLRAKFVNSRVVFTIFSIAIVGTFIKISVKKVQNDLIVNYYLMSSLMKYLVAKIDSWNHYNDA